MAIDPSQIDLTPQQRQRLAELAEQAGRPWPEVLSDALNTYRPRSDRPAADEEVSLADALAADGLIGCIDGSPPDLSSNPQYLEGFGRDHGPRAD